MDLLGKVAVAVIVLVIIFSGIFLLITSTAHAQALTSAQAENVVLNDVKASNPNATVSVISLTNSTLTQGKNQSYDIVLSIVYNATRACPTLFIEGFNYPVFHLVPSVDNLYTHGNQNNCIISGLVNSTNSTYVISSPYVAIARTYNQSVRTTQVINYIKKYGYYNTNVTAKFYPVLNNTQTHLAGSMYNVWVVHFKASNANYSIYDILDSSDAIAGNYTTTP